ncbi:AraC family transcriptional regulator [Paenibacillus sp. D51F]
MAHSHGEDVACMSGSGGYPAGLLDYSFRDDGQVMQDFHSHPYYEIYFFHEGDCTYLIGSRIYRLEPGDMLLMYGMTLHRPKVDPSQPYVRSIIHFYPDPLRAASPSGAQLPVMRPFEELRNYRLSLRGEHREEAELILARMDRFKKQGDAAGLYRMKLAFEDLLGFIYERCQEPMNLAPERSRDKEQIAQDIMDYIGGHLSEELTLERLQSELHLSRSYLSRTFREVTGVQLFEYIYKQRVNQARVLFLLEPDISVTEAGFRVGFKHPAHFSRLFKQTVGMSADKYRRSLPGF